MYNILVETRKGNLLMVEIKREVLKPSPSRRNGKGRVRDPPCCAKMPMERVAPPPSH